MVTVNEMVKKAHANAVEKGWWPEGELLPPVSGQSDIDRRKSLKSLILTEIAEVIECVREGQMETVLRHDGKPEGFPSELADVALRCFDFAGALGMDFESELRELEFSVSDVGPIYLGVSLVPGASEEPPITPERICGLLYDVAGLLYAAADQHGLAYTYVGVAALADECGVDLAKEIILKHGYNVTRPHRHGNKAL